MTYLHAVVIGVIEGLTEFLPVSSTGHLLLTNALLGNTSEFSKTFDIAIQSGAMLAVVAYTWREWFKVQVLTRVFAGFLPTAVIGLALYPFVKAYLLTPTVVVIALAVGGLVMLAFERWYAPRLETAQGEASVVSLTHRQAALVGLAQVLALVPGVSRSAATILGGLAMKLPRATVVLYSFLLAVPTIGAATAYDLWKQRALLSGDAWGVLAVGTVVSGVVAALVIRWFLAFIRRHSFAVFAYERLIVAALAWWILLR